MAKQLNLNKSEQERVTNAILVVGEILLLKMDEGVETPTIEGTMNIDNENKKVTFIIKAQSK